MLECRTFRVYFAVALLTGALVCGGVTSAQEKLHPVAVAADYEIVAGDVIRIDVWKYPDISRTISIPRDGIIQLPLIHTVRAKGLSAMQLAGLLRDKLTAAIPNPQVTVTVVVIHGAIPAISPAVRPLQPPPLPSPQLRDTPSPEPRNRNSSEREGA